MLLLREESVLFKKGSVMIEVISNLPELDTNVFMVPPGFKKNEEHGAYEIDREYINQLDRKISAIQETKEGNSGRAIEMRKERFILDFFNTPSRYDLKDASPAVTEKATLALWLQEFADKLAALGPEPNEEAVVALEKEYGILRSENAWGDPLNFGSQLRTIGIFSKDELTAITQFIKDNAAFMKQYLNHKNSVRKVFGSKFTADVGTIRQNDGGPKVLLTPIPTDALRFDLPNKFDVSKVKKYFEEEIVDIPNLREKFRTDIVQRLEPVTEDTNTGARYISEGTWYVAKYLQEQMREAESAAPEAAPLYQSLLQTMVDYYSEQGVEPDQFRQQMALNSQELAKQRAEAKSPPKQSLVQTLRNLLK